MWTSAISNVGAASVDCAKTAVHAREERMIPAKARIVIRTSAEVEDEIDYARLR
jgi:hypothetical protein